MLILALAASASPAVGDEAEDQYAVSAGLYARQQWDLAAEAFGEFVARFPNHSKADPSVFFMAEALLQQHDWEKASAGFAEYLRRSPDGSHARSARFRLAEAAYLAGRLDRARDDLEAFHRDHPDDPRTVHLLAYLGEIGLARGDDQAAADFFRRARTISRDGPLRDNIRLGLARALQQLGKSNEADALYREVIAEGPGAVSAEARFRLGAFEQARGRHTQAVATLLPLEESTSASEWQLSGRLVRGVSLRSLGQLDQAAALLGSLTADPRLGAEAQYWLAAVYKDRQQWDDAANLLVAAAGQFPEHRLNSAMRVQAGHALFRAGRMAEAGEQFDHVLNEDSAEDEWLDDAAMGKLQLAQLAGDHAEIDRQAEPFLARFAASPLADDARHAWARSLVARREYARAIELLEKLAVAKPDDRAVWARAHLAVGLAKLGRWEDADATVAILLEQHPEHGAVVPALEQFAETAYESRDWTRAEQAFQMIVERDGDKPSVDRAISGLGWVRLNRGEWNEAAEWFQKLLERKPEKHLAADAAWARAHALEKLGRNDEALTLYHDAIDQKPDGSRTPKILLSVARLHGRLGQNDQAATIYERLAMEHPDEEQLDAVLYEWSWALSDQGSDDEAAACLERLHREFPKSRYWDDATYRLAERAFESGDHEAAERLIDEVLAVGDGKEIEPYALALKWRVAAARQRWDAVGAAARRLLDRHPADSFRHAARFWLAESLYRRGDHDGAADVFESLAEETGDENESWRAMVPLRRAQIAASRKEWLDAHELASSIERDYPDFECQHEADYVVGRALAARAEFDAARDAYQRVIRSPRGAKTETAAMAQWMIGETYFHQKNFEAALREYLRVEILYAYP
ncbi:MAG TPA: hypothetical protein DD670_07470, partial [Planctomycetaceae bacterium]|nr:hypothetical protein [Planctomycetaceae bacterium]